jgi:hypothetical protein
MLPGCGCDCHAHPPQREKISPSGDPPKWWNSQSTAKGTKTAIQEVPMVGVLAVFRDRYNREPERHAHSGWVKKGDQTLLNSIAEQLEPALPAIHADLRERLLSADVRSEVWEPVIRKGMEIALDSIGLGEGD